MNTEYPRASATSAQINSIPVCHNCGTSTTPLWRHDEAGNVICNACGLFLRLHGRPRPISLKTDVIRSRNRRKSTKPATPSSDPNGLPSSYPDEPPKKQSYPAAHPAFNQPSTSIPPLQPPPQHPPLLSPSETTSNGDTNIAPQHVFDRVTITLGPPEPSSPQHPLQANPKTLTESATPLADDPPRTVPALLAQNSQLRIRVSELEVINELFRGRVSELEVSEREARDELERLHQALEVLKGVGEGGRKRVRSTTDENAASEVRNGNGNGTRETREARETSSNFMMP